MSETPIGVSDLLNSVDADGAIVTFSEGKFIIDYYKKSYDSEKMMNVASVSLSAEVYGEVFLDMLRKAMEYERQFGKSAGLPFSLNSSSGEGDTK